MRGIDNTKLKAQNILISNYLNEIGLKKILINKFIRDYNRYCLAESSIIAIFSHDEISFLVSNDFAKDFIKLFDYRDIMSVFLGYYLKLLETKNIITSLYNESKSWDNIINRVACTSDNSHESIIECLEETYKTCIKDGNHLKMITGATGESLSRLYDIVINSKYSRYFRALVFAISEGNRYKDLLKITPEDFGLPKNWSGCLGSNQESTILLAIYFFYSIPEFSSIGMFAIPDIRKIAKELEMPVHVLTNSSNNP